MSGTKILKGVGRLRRLDDPSTGGYETKNHLDAHLIPVNREDRFFHARVDLATVHLFRRGKGDEPTLRKNALATLGTPLSELIAVGKLNGLTVQ